tara:strand:- start:10 stop:753 length:744 start_codon:yes stop_codon:yes gene_type:complete
MTTKHIFENWRKHLDEDAESRGRFAKDVENLPSYVSSGGAEETNPTKKMATMGRGLKKIFAKEADRSFMTSLTTVHWGELKDIITLIKDYKTLRRDELSAVAHLSPSDINLKGPWGFDYGVVIKGHITLLANDMNEVGSGGGRRYKKDLPAQRTKSSGANKGVQKISYHGDYRDHPIIVLDRDDWEPRVMNGTNYNEALVDNWKIEAVIVSYDSHNIIREIQQFEKYLSKFGLSAIVGTPSRVSQNL